MFRKAAIAIAVMLVFSAGVQAQSRGSGGRRNQDRNRTDRSRTVRTPSVRVRVNSSDSRPGFDNRRPGFDNRRRGFDNRRRGFDNRRRGFDNSRNRRSNRNRSFGSFGNGHHHHQHQYREWVLPIYGHHEVKVWVQPVYRTVHDDCHHASIQIGFGGFGLQFGGCEGQSMLVSEGHHEIRTVRYVVHEGYYRSRLSCLSCGHARITFRIGF